MNSITSLFQSTLGKKFIMAATGAVLFLFVIGHMLGNLQVFGPPAMINIYGNFLQTTPEVLWSARTVLSICVILHIVTAIQLSVQNKAARPVGYVGGTSYGSTWQSRYMLVSGLVILAFILYHLAHFTVCMPSINGVGDFTQLKTVLPGGIVAHDVYAMMILGFQVWWVVVFYLIAQALLFIHLSHGVASMFQSLGFRNHVWAPRIKKFAQITSVLIFLGYSIIPIAIYMRVIGADYADKKRIEIKAGGLMTEAVGKEVAK